MKIWTFYNSRRSSRGDTIVEVLFALAILGAVLGSSYVVVSRNIKISRASQERHEAIKLAESQLERLKIKANDDSTILVQNNFCLTDTNSVVSSTNISCKVDSSGTPTTEFPQYKMEITRVPDVLTPPGTRFKVTVGWENVKGTGNDKLDYYYEVYE